MDEPPGSVLEAKALGVRFRDAAGESFDALSGISARFRSSRLTIVAGPSGSGKTTLLHCLAGIRAPSAGEVTFAGTTISKLGEGARDAWRRRTCGMVFQDFRLIDELSVMGNVLVPALFDHFRVPRALRERAADLLRELDLPGKRHAASRLSRGERQRVAIARALLLDPAIVLADEPTASLDRANAAAVGDILAGLAARGKTVVCVSHDEHLAARADEVIRLDKGRLAASAGEWERVAERKVGT